MIDLGRETDSNNEICLGVRFALCIIKALWLTRIEHCSGTVVTRFLPTSLEIRGIVYSSHEHGEQVQWAKFHVDIPSGSRLP